MPKKRGNGKTKRRVNRTKHRVNRTKHRVNRTKHRVLKKSSLSLRKKNKMRTRKYRHRGGSGWNSGSHYPFVGKPWKYVNTDYAVCGASSDYPCMAAHS